MTPAEIIKNTLKMQDVFSKYGYSMNRNGFMRCPFHEEKTASLKAYADDTKWKCFGCGRGGTVIDFVMELFGINFGQAVVRISSDFGLNLTSEKADARKMIELRKRKKKEEQELLSFRSEYMNYVYRYRYYWNILKYTDIPKPDDLLSHEIAAELSKARSEIDYLDNWFSENPWR